MADKVAREAPELAKQVAHGEKSLPQAVKELRPPDDDADATPTLAEQLEMARDVAADLAAEVETLRAAGSVDGAEAEIRRLKAMLSAVEAERDMYRNRANEAIRQVKALQRKVDQMERGK